MMEGGQGCLVGLQPVDKELYRESHPVTLVKYSCCAYYHGTFHHWPSLVVLVVSSSTSGGAAADAEVLNFVGHSDRSLPASVLP
jgi:hypothetical protein